jgi:hypothetical protein
METKHVMHYRSKLDQFIYGCIAITPFASKFVVEVCVVAAKLREKGDDVDKIIIRSLFCVYCLAYVVFVKEVFRVA